MAKLTMHQKAERVLRLLMGTRRGTVTASLAAYGFTEAVADEGWKRLRAVAGRAAEARAAPIPRKADPLHGLQAWEKRWFPIAVASLQYRHPEIAAGLFRNLARAQGPEVLMTMPVFLDRLAQLTETEAGRAALALLAERGLTDAVLDEARALVAAFPTLVVDAAPVDDEEAFREADAALWRWYLEWSAIARIAIADKRALQAMGLRRANR